MKRGWVGLVGEEFSFIYSLTFLKLLTLLYHQTQNPKENPKPIYVHVLPPASLPLPFTFNFLKVLSYARMIV